MMVDLSTLSLRQNMLLKWLKGFRDLKPFGMEAFLLTDGRWYEPGDIVPVGMLDTPKQCFMNCQKSVTDHEAYRYCEGMAMSEGLPMPVHHAWLTVDDKVLDPTWAKFTKRTIYYGVTLKTEAVEIQLLKVQRYQPMLFQTHAALRKMIDGKTIREPV